MLVYVSMSKFGCYLFDRLLYNKYLKLLEHVFGIVQIKIEMLTASVV